MRNNKTFKIGELCKLFEIGADSIRYYEKVGILHPLRDENNNYRLYTIEDVRKITLIRELLNLNFTTEQIRQYDENRNLAVTLELLTKELSIADEELKKCQEKRQNIKQRLQTIQNLSNLPATEEIHILDLPERNCVMVNDSNLPDAQVDYYLTKYIHSAGKQIDTIGACDCYTLDLPGSNPDSLYYRTKNVFFYSAHIPKKDCNYLLPEGKYLSIYYRGPLKKTKELLPGMYAYATSHHLNVTGEPIEFCHIDNYETHLEDEFVIEIQLPVSAR